MKMIKRWFGGKASAKIAEQEAGQKVVMIVGMHRSGTSFLTGSLQEAGLELGKYSEKNPFNLKGNRENEDIVALHDRVLSARSFAWDEPPSKEIDWTPEEMSAAQEIISGYSGVECWGFKDPRALLLVEGWLKLIPHMQFVGIFRHPAAVAQSLESRQGMSREKAFRLWKAYNERLLKLYKQRKFPVLCFDEEDAVLLRKLDRVIQDLGLNKVEGDRFFSPELKHHRQADGDTPSDVRKLHAELCSIAL